jgi:hypothetical protein
MARRPFNPDALKSYAVSWIRPNIGQWSVVWRYTVYVPSDQAFPDGKAQSIATPDDLTNLELMLVSHFEGITVLSPQRGMGARDSRNPKASLEVNKHAVYVVYAPAAPISDNYFQALRAELQDALGEGIVLIERQEALLL